MEVEGGSGGIPIETVRVLLATGLLAAPGGKDGRGEEVAGVVAWGDAVEDVEGEAAGELEEKDCKDWFGMSGFAAFGEEVWDDVDEWIGRKGMEILEKEILTNSTYRQCNSVANVTGSPAGDEIAHGCSALYDTDSGKSKLMFGLCSLESGTPTSKLEIERLSTGVL